MPYIIRFGKNYVAEDKASGGYRYASPYLASAILFDIKEAALRELTSSDYNKSSKMASGVVFPPPMIHRLAELDNQKTFAEGDIEICEVVLVPVATKHIVAQITR